MKRIKDNRRKRFEKKSGPAAKPEWVEAFLILLLHKTGGTLTVSLESLKKFCKLKKHNKTQMSWDPENESITIRAPEVDLPDRIWKPENKKIIKNLS